MLSVITLFLVIFCVSFNGCCNWMYWRIQKWFIHFNVFTSKFNLSPLALVHKKLYENWTVDSSQTNMYHVKVELVPFIFDNYYAKYSTPLSELTLFFFSGFLCDLAQSNYMDAYKKRRSLFFAHEGERPQKNIEKRSDETFWKHRQAGCVFCFCVWRGDRLMMTLIECQAKSNFSYIIIFHSHCRRSMTVWNSLIVENHARIGFIWMISRFMRELTTIIVEYSPNKLLFSSQCFPFIVKEIREYITHDSWSIIWY